MKKYDKKLVAIGISIVGIVVVLTMGLTYAFFSVNIIGNDEAEPTVIDTAYLKLVFNDTQFLRLENTLPGASASKTFTVTNNSSIKIKYDINIIDVYNTFQNDELLYSLTSINNGREIAEEVLPNIDGLLTGKIDIDPGVTHTYTMIIKFKETGTDQNYNQGAEFRGKLQINTSTAYSEDVIFEIESSAGEVYMGSSKEVNILGSYYGEVSCESENTNIAECSAEQNKIVIEGKSRGVTNLKVTEDIKNTELMYSVRVLEPSLGLSETSGDIIVSTTKNIEVTGEDYGTLSCETSDSTIATCTISGNTLNITGLKMGTVTITVTESNNNIEVDYTASVKDVVVWILTSKEEVATENTITATISCLNCGTLSCETSDSNIATCAIDGTILSVTGKNPGSVAITVRESNINKTANYNLTVKHSLTHKILSDNTAQSDSSINFNSVAGNGLYYTANNQYGEDNERIYYYRGRVENNWVSFGEYLWRIVRTTSEGGIRLIYSGNASTTSSGFISTSTFNTNTNNKYHVGYTYNTSGYATLPQTDSTIKTVVDTWYNTNLKEHENYLSTTAVYCNDRNIERVDGSQIYYPAYDRLLTNHRPTYACPSINASRYTLEESNGNGYLTNPIALLTADEINYAGVITSNNLNSYIMDNSTGVTRWWTMSPASFFQSNAIEFTIYSEGNITNNLVNTAFGVRPAVSIKSCIIVTGGNGTKASPYTLSNSTC